MERGFFVAGAISAFLAVAAGAFGAHALKARLTPEMLGVFETGVRYQAYHALALLAAGWAEGRFGHGLISIAGGLFAAGTVVFSGSLYALALTGTKTWGIITPIGGLMFLGGWLCLGMGVWRS